MTTTILVCDNEEPLRALCREIVESHGGRIGFESAEGEGSTS